MVIIEMKVDDNKSPPCTYVSGLTPHRPHHYREHSDPFKLLGKDLGLYRMHVLRLLFSSKVSGRLSGPQS